MAVWNRTPERAAARARSSACGRHGAPEPAELLVNVTSVGLHGEDPPAQLELVERGVVADLVYGSEPDALCRWAERRGARVVDGLEVLRAPGRAQLRALDGVRGAPRCDAARARPSRV